MATLKLLAKIELTETYQLIRYFSKNYGKVEDEKIILITNTDGPCFSQYNGTLGLLAIVALLLSHPPALYYLELRRHLRKRKSIV